MDEIKKEGQCPEGCECFMCKHGMACKGKGGVWCGHGMYGNHILARIVLMLLILAFVFFAGFWFGNMASLFRHGGYADGYGMMRGGLQNYNYRNLNARDYQGSVDGGKGMMRSDSPTAPNATSSRPQVQPQAQ